jgi:hypothetical protein
LTCLWASAMPGKIYRYLADDHVRLEGLFQRATARPDSIDLETYAAFRAGLLKHIAMEEKILLAAAQRMRGAAGADADTCDYRRHPRDS